MNRGFLLSLLSCGLLVTAVGCGDDDGSGGSGGGTTTSSTTTGNNTSSTTKATTGGMTTASTTGSSMAATCEAYCAAIDTACGEPFAQYPSVESCLEICPAFMQGTAGDTSMNTLECRAYHTTAVGADMQDPHCTHAGPLGGGPEAGNGCGMMRCSSFCAAATAVCDGNNVVWATEAECMTDCALFPDTFDYNTLETGGDTLACRMYHMTVAAGAKATGDMTGFADHCSHIALVSDPCG
jgi:hypothetical protein